MREVFAEMPQRIMPLMTRNNRLDCIDMIEGRVEAKVRNSVDQYVTLEVLNADYLRLQTSSSSTTEMKLLPYKGTQLIAMVQTVHTDHFDDSVIAFYDMQWQQQDVSLFYTEPQTDAYFHESHHAADSVSMARRAIADFHPTRMDLSAEECTLTITLQLGDMETTLRPVAEDSTQPMTMKWDSLHFTPFFR